MTGEHDVSKETPSADTYPILDEAAGRTFVARLKHGLCTPLLGPEVTRQETRERRDTAAEWARETGFPFDQTHDLPRAAESLCLAMDRLEPRLRVQDRWSDVHLEDRQDAEVYDLLAEMPLPLYICTSHHDLMCEALRNTKIRDPQLQLFAWNEGLRTRQSQGDKRFDPNIVPRVSHPVVFHWHGHLSERESLVVTERDHMEFLYNAASIPEQMPSAIDMALSSTYLLFLGYRLFDLHFQVLLRVLKKNLAKNPLRDRHIAVQFVDIEREQHRARAETYLRKYFEQEQINVVLGDPVGFVRELHHRMKELEHAH